MGRAEVALAHPFEDGAAAVLLRSLDETAPGMGPDEVTCPRLAPALGRGSRPALRRHPAADPEPATRAAPIYPTSAP